MSTHRIVTLIASATEIVSALGFEEQLVGRSHECDYPPSIETLPACSEPKLDTNGSSREIDDRVRAIAGEALSVYRVHTDILERLKPDVIVTQDHCEVCAVSLKDVEQAVCEILDSNPQIVSLSPNDLADIWKDIRLVADALDCEDRAETLIDQLQHRLEEISKRACCLAYQPTIACIEWIDPLMSAGNWVPELVEIAGGIDLLGKGGEHSEYMTWESLVEADPDVIAILPCGFDIPRCRKEMPPLLEQPGWNDLKAVCNHRVYLTDGNQYFNRPGPRVVESAEILAEILHPGEFDFGHEGTGWVRL
jgi:iron complex transport system substrate-binding protein